MDKHFDDEKLTYDIIGCAMKFLVAVAAIFLSACQSVIKPFPSSPSEIEDLNRRSANRPVGIILKNGTQEQGYRLAVRTDSTEWYESDSISKDQESHRRSVITDSIASIDFQAPNGYIWKHPIINGAGYAVIFDLLYVYSTSSMDIKGFGTSPSKPILLGSLLKWGGIGLLFGGAVGLASGALADAINIFYYKRESIDTTKKANEYQNGNNLKPNADGRWK